MASSKKPVAVEKIDTSASGSKPAFNSDELAKRDQRRRDFEKKIEIVVHVVVAASFIVSGIVGILYVSLHKIGG